MRPSSSSRADRRFAYATASCRNAQRRTDTAEHKRLCHRRLLKSRSQVNATCAPVSGSAHWSQVNTGAKRRPQAPCVRTTAGPSGRLVPPLGPVQGADQNGEHGPALVGEPVPVVDHDKHTVGGEDRQPVGDRTGRRAELGLKVGEPAHPDERRDQQARTPSDCPARSWSAGTGPRRRRCGRHLIVAASRSPAWSVATNRSDPTVRQRLSRWWSHHMSRT